MSTTMTLWVCFGALLGAILAWRLEAAVQTPRYYIVYLRHSKVISVAVYKDRAERDTQFLKDFRVDPRVTLQTCDEE